jgi:hypothetical protein
LDINNSLRVPGVFQFRQKRQVSIDMFLEFFFLNQTEIYVSKASNVPSGAINQYDQGLSGRSNQVTIWYYRYIFSENS